MAAARRLPAAVVDAVRDSKILRIRAGGGDHRFIGIWAVVVERRVFVRSWTLKPDGWYHALLDDPHGAILVDGREIVFRAVRTRSARLLTAVDEAYAEKYDTRASLKYVRGFKRGARRASTTELTPSTDSPKSRR
jgi:hypothetical protein